MRRVVLIVLAAIAAITSAEVLAWWLHSRQTLQRRLPDMVENTFREEERRMYPLTSRPSSIKLVLGRTVAPGLRSHAQELFAAALRPIAVEIAIERRDWKTGQRTYTACRGCEVLEYREIANNPFFGHVRVEFSSGGFGGRGYDEYFIHLFGRWVHVRTRLAWIS